MGSLFYQLKVIFHVFWLNVTFLSNKMTNMTMDKIPVGARDEYSSTSMQKWK